MKRRDFLQSTIVAGFLPLSGLRLDRLFGFQKTAIADAKRLHDKVLAAFDFGATLPPEPWLGNYWTSRFAAQESDLICAQLQNAVPKLRRGCTYQIVTAWREDGKIGAWLSSVRRPLPVGSGVYPSLEPGGPTLHRWVTRRHLS